jgi:putative CocE/NonD family hydrolase
MSRRRTAPWICLWLLLALELPYARAQEFDFHPPAQAGDAAAIPVMRDLAARMLPVYEESDAERYLANLSALQTVAGDYPAAYATRESLRERRRSTDPGRPLGRSVVFDTYVHARALQVQSHVPFAPAFTQSFHETLGRLADPQAYELTGWFATPLATYQEPVQRVFDQRRAKGTIALHDAMDLVWSYLWFEAYRSFGPLVGALNAEEDRRRYASEDDLLIEADGGVMLSARLVRPRSFTKPLPALLEFTPDVDAPNYTKESAAHGYVGVVAYARGTRGSRAMPVPYEHDGEDARAVIEWIAKQPWSDGRVGMYGSGYSGFTAWAAAKRPPKALKAIATTAGTAPGVDRPALEHIYPNAAYRWAALFTGSIDKHAYEDASHWRSLDESWYRSGRSYRELDQVYGKNVHVFRRWLNHPSYDLYWQKLVPFREQFAHLHIPALSIAGYYGPGEVGALYYYSQHHRYDPHADHTLLIGPYDDAVMQGPATVLRGYTVDSAALVDLREVRYQWFDSVLKGAPRPALLQSPVNYELMGRNEWRHAASVDAMARGNLRLYLDSAPEGDRHRLTARKPSPQSLVRQSVSLADRNDADWVPNTDIVAKSLATHYSLTFFTAPTSSAMAVSGLLSGRLDVTPNKMDLDFSIAIYELTSGGDYVELSDPYQIRASYVRDPVHRHLLKAGERQTLTFRSDRLTAREIAAGSRIVLVLSINKRADQQLNYGSGSDVSEESIEDAKVPLRIRWHGTSYVDLPVDK